MEDYEEIIKEQIEGSEAAQVALLVSLRKIVEKADNKQEVLDTIDEMLKAFETAEDDDE